MPKLVGVRERRHQPFYDTLVRAAGAPAANVQNRTRLFSGGGLGQLALTNMEGSGQFPSDQTFVTLSLQVHLHFRPIRGGSAVGVPPAGGAGGLLFPGGAPAEVAHRLYFMCQSQLFWTYFVGDKPQFTHTTWYAPAGGGIHGFAADTTLTVLNNGVPEKGAILKLAKPILVPPRQGFQVTGEIINPVASAAIGALPAVERDLVTALNNDIEGIEKDIKYLIDGVHTRDVL